MKRQCEVVGGRSPRSGRCAGSTIPSPGAQVMLRSPIHASGLRGGTTVDATGALVGPAAEAAWNMRLLSNTHRRRHSSARPTPTWRSLASTSSRATTPARSSGISPIRGMPVLAKTDLCPASQNDVSVYKNLLIMSNESNSGRLDCGGQGIKEHGEHGAVAWRPDLRHQRHQQSEVRRQCADLPRFAYAHRRDRPAGPDNFYIYISGQAGVRSGRRAAGLFQRCRRTATRIRPASASR